MSCLLTWKTGLPSLKTACITTPSEYMSEAESQLTDRMYSGARYSGLGRQSGGWLGSHSLHAYLGYRGPERTFRSKMRQHRWTWEHPESSVSCLRDKPQLPRGWWRRCWSQNPWSSRIRSCWGWCFLDTSCRGPFSLRCGGRTNPPRSGPKKVIKERRYLAFVRVLQLMDITNGVDESTKNMMHHALDMTPLSMSMK